MVLVGALCAILEGCGDAPEEPKPKFDRTAPTQLKRVARVSNPGPLIQVLPIDSQGRTLVALGYHGSIMRSIDGGENWTNQDSKTDTLLRQLTSLDSNGQVLVAVGESGTILRSSDKGVTWERQESNSDRNLQDVIGLGAGVVVAIGDFGVVLRSSDGGVTWKGVPSNSRGHLSHIARVGSEGQALVSVGTDGTIVRSNDGGESWAKMESHTERTLLHVLSTGESGRALVSVGEGGAIVMSGDGGETWKEKSSKSEADLQQVISLDAAGNTLVAVGSGGQILRSPDGGINWSEVASNTNSMLIQVIRLSKDGKSLVAIEKQEGVVRSEDYGVHWAHESSSVDTAFLRVTSVDGLGGTLVAVGLDARIWRSQDSGKTWSVKSSQVFHDLHRVTSVGKSGKSLIAVGDNGAIVQSDDGGKTWIVRDSHTTNDLRDVTSVDADGKTLVAVGAGSAFVQSEDGGRNWTLRNKPIGSQFESVTRVGRDGKALVAVGEYGVVLLSEDGGVHWTRKERRPGPSLTQVISLGPDGKTLVAVGWQGAILRSQDFGRSWEEQESHTTGHLQHVINPGEDGLTLVAVGWQGTIVRSKDGGRTWEVQSSSTHNNLMRVASLNPTGSKLVVVGDQGTILRSIDGGTVWETQSANTRSDLHCVTSLGLEGMWLVAVGTGNTILRSQDGGQNWASQDLESSRDDEKLLRHVISSGSHSKTLVAVGKNGSIFSDVQGHEYETAAMTGALAEYDRARNPVLTVEFAAKPASAPVVVGFGKLHHERWRKVGKPEEKPSPAALLPSAVQEIKGTGGRRWRITLDPGFFNVSEPESIFVRVAVRGPGFAYGYPAPDAFFEIPNHPQPMSAWLTGSIGALAAVSLLFALSWWRPLLLLRLASGGALEVPSGSKVPAPVGLFLSLVGKVLMPLLVKQPWVLDAWVRHHSEGFQRAFSVDTKSATEQATNYEPLPVETDGGEVLKPSGAAIRRLCLRPTNCLQIVARGGAGKTRLAMALGGWVFDGELMSCPAIAVFIDEEFDDLWKLLLTRVNRILGNDEAVTATFLAVLVKTGRVWVIVDRLSERTSKTQAAFAAIYDLAQPFALVCTARQVIPIAAMQPVVVRPMPLDNATLLGFLESQLRAAGATAHQLRLKDVGTLVNRLSQQITLGSEELPVTPLLVKVFVSQAVELLHSDAHRALEALPASVPEAYFRYVERLDAALSGAEKLSAALMHPRLRKAAALLAYAELGEDFRPKPVSSGAMEAVLKQFKVELGEVDFVQRCIANGLLSARQIGAELRLEFLLDPLAECLAAHEHALRCGTSIRAWTALVDKVACLGGAGFGFLLALRMNHAAYSEAFGFPVVEFSRPLVDEAVRE